RHPADSGRRLDLSRLDLRAGRGAAALSRLPRRAGYLCQRDPARCGSAGDHRPRAGAAAVAAALPGIAAERADADAPAPILALDLHAQVAGDGEDVLVAAAAEVHHDQVVPGQRG